MELGYCHQLIGVCQRRTGNGHNYITTSKVKKSSQGGFASASERRPNILSPILPVRPEQIHQYYVQGGVLPNAGNSDHLEESTANDSRRKM